MLEKTPPEPVNAAKPDKPKRPKKTISDRGLKALKSAPKSTTYDQMDSVVPGFGVRVSETGRKTFILIARFPGSPHPTRRALGIYGALTLEKAREKARDWHALIRKGVDPREDEERQRLAEQRKRGNTFANVVEDFIRLAVIGPDPENPKQRRGAKVARELRQFFVPLWGGKPVAEITRENIQNAIKGIRDYGARGMLAAHGIKDGKRGRTERKGAPGQARNLLGNLKTLFAWAIEVNEYGIEQSPARDIRAKTLVGAKMSRDRQLTDVEVAALWRAIRRLRYPFGPVYRLLVLTGLRLNEVVNASWQEFDLKEKLWTIPKERMKGTDEKARPHAVPLTDQMLAILESLPRFKRGDFLFSLSLGARPAAVDDKIKIKIDAKMLRSLRALARMRGEDPTKVKLGPWVNHDLRRTVRSGLSRLKVDHDVKEAVLAHAKPGIAGVYDRYDLLDEKRKALKKWAAHLRDIVQPLPANVVKLSGRA
ncbi:MAG TPA: integrase arm-type DNA-binding domain-containing protein [Pseudolabrys sp.]